MICGLIDAVKSGDFTTVKELIESGVAVNLHDEEHEWSPLHWASGKGNIEVVKMLLEKGADVTKTGRDQRTPYQIALASSRSEVAKFFKRN